MADHSRTQTATLYVRCEPDLPDLIREAARAWGGNPSQWMRRVLRLEAEKATKSPGSKKRSRGA